MTSLVRWHLAVLAAAAGYLAWAHPGSGGAVLLVAGLAAACQLALPAAWNAIAAPAAILAASASAAYAGAAELHAALGIALVGLLLVPVRADWLPLVSLLAMFELVWLGGRPGGGLAQAAAAVPIAIIVLAAAPWAARQRLPLRPQLRGGAAGSGMPARWRSLLQWLALPALAACLLAAFAGPAVEGWRAAPTAAARPVELIRAEPAGEGGGMAMRLVDLPGIASDEQVRARLILRRAPEADAPMIYLRALALARISASGGEIAWDAEAPSGPVEDPPPGPATGDLYRMRDGNDVVLRLDQAPGVGLTGLLGDNQGNRWLPGLGARPRVYAVSTALVGEPPAAPAALAAYRAIPPALAGLPWERIEDPRWRGLPVRVAGTAVSAFLASHCTYALDGAADPGGALRGFLWGPAGQRRGHCQFFATAAALLLRRAGFAARCVVGYASDEIEGTTVVFRAKHAHAWVEAAGPDGRWVRIDPTPGNQLSSDPEVPPWSPAATAAEIAPGATAAAPAGAAADGGGAGDAAPAAAVPWVGIAAAAALIALAWIAWPRRRDGDELRNAVLDRRAQTLVQVAIGLGIRVGPATTISVIARELGRRTGMDLTWWRDAHLRSRYAGGPLPPPWPIEQIRRAAALRRRDAGPPPG